MAVPYLAASIGLTLVTIGEDGSEQWACRLSGESGELMGHCCAAGHFTPEAAAQHGAELAAPALARYVRALAADTHGGQVLARTG